MTDEGQYSSAVTPSQGECQSGSLAIYCTLSLCKAAAEVVNYTKAGWEHVATLANEGETQWHFISTLASPFPLFTPLCGPAVTRSSPLICVPRWLQTQAQILTHVFMNILKRISRSRCYRLVPGKKQLLSCSNETQMKEFSRQSDILWEIS